jgi:hypothetical protein
LYHNSGRIASVFDQLFDKPKWYDIHKSGGVFLRFIWVIL